ncbi:MAG: hypothetical protein QG649_195 [Patescibacteria group bacterium]|nr:hypothetical protein [Patescibacteria group bacterium]
MIRTSKGFTIVELLIVIVVIGVLAAITIVAFENARTRASNSQTTSAMKEYIKAFYTYGVENGSYPNTSGCLGSNYPAPNNRCLSQSGASECFGMGASNSNTINDALKPYMGGKLPQMSMQQAPCGATGYAGGYASFNSTNGTMGTWMVLRGDQACPTMSPNVTSVSKVYSGDATLCRYILASVS